MRPTPFKAIAHSLGHSHSSSNLITGAAIDSRLVRQGDLFFALKGNRVDGHDFLKEAFDKGATAAIVHEDYKGPHYDVPLLRVPDVLESLQLLAKKRVQARDVKVIAISGSLGKTMTKMFAATLLGAAFDVFHSPLSYNSQATLPLSLLISQETEQIVLLEMGMTHPGQIAQLTAIAPPDVALLTTVALQHTVNFPDGLEGVTREKATLFAHAKTTTGIIHRDIRYFDQVCSVGSCEKINFSLITKEADYYLEETEKGMSLFYKGKKTSTLSLRLPLKVHAQNFLAAVALARQFDLPWSLIEATAPLIKLPPMRFEKVVKEGVLFINDAYNASPDSMQAALEGLPTPLSGGRKIGILSEMDALGTYSDEAHVHVTQVALKHLDLLFCIGKRWEKIMPLWRASDKPIFHLESIEAIALTLKEIVKPTDLVLLKGARSYGLEKILTYF